jgi:LEA14-like dessication related protein
VTAAVRFADLLRVLSGVKPGALVPYAADFKVGVDAPGVGRLTLPLRKEGEVPIPTVPDVRLTKVEWTRLELTEARAVLHLAVDNRNAFAVDLARLGFDLSFGGAKVAGSRIEKATKFAAGGEQAIEIPISLSPVELGMGVFNILRGRDASYSLAGTLDVKTPFGPLAMPYETSGRVPFVRE